MSLVDRRRRTVTGVAACLSTPEAAEAWRPSGIGSNAGRAQATPAVVDSTDPET
jgi:hypothetical protein